MLQKRKDKKLTVSLVTFNGARHLPFCLQSIRAQTFQDFDVVILDNHSSDDTREVISHVYPSAHLIMREKNSGFSGGHNSVISQTITPYVCVLNQDVVLDPDYFYHCMQWMESLPYCGAVQGMLLRVKELTHHPQSDRIDSCGITLHPLFQHIASLDENKLKYAHTKEQHVFGVTGTAPLYRMQAIKECAVTLDGKTEYFDEDFFMYKEDVDLAYRLHGRGWQSWCVPRAVAYHIRTAKSTSLISGRTRPEKVNEWSYRNHFFVLMKNISIGTFLRYAPGIVCYELAKAFYHGVRSPATVISALRDVVRLRSRMMKKRAIIFSAR
jgi:GT2 family glycosyltransferase